MSRKLNFAFDVQKFVNASAYLVERCPETTRMKLAKLLFFADKEHLLTYGRPVIGDRYVKMEYGPVPSAGYNLIKRDERAAVEDQSIFDRHLTVHGNDVTLKAPADLRHLSETDIEVLNEVVAKYGHLTPAQLSTLSHREPAWMQAEMNAELDYRLLFANRNDAENVELLVQEDQELRDALSELEFEEFFESLRS